MSSLATSSGSLNTSIVDRMVVEDGEGEHRERPASVERDDSRGTVYECRANIWRETAGAHRPFRHLRGAVQLERVAVPSVGTKHDVRVEHCDESIEVTVAGGREIRVHHCLLSSRSGSGGGAASRTRRRARLASWRVACGERSTIAAISSNGTANMSWSTNASRSAGVSVSRTTCNAIPTASASNASCSGSIPAAGLSMIGSGRRPSSGCSPRVRRDRSRFRQILATTTVSHRSRLSICSASTRR